MLFSFCSRTIEVRRVATLVATEIPTACRLNCSAESNRQENMVGYITRVCSLERWYPAIETDRKYGEQNTANQLLCQIVPYHLIPIKHLSTFHFGLKWQELRQTSSFKTLFPSLPQLQLQPSRKLEKWSRRQAAAPVLPLNSKE